jgi:UPF0716 protein FxsA
MALLLALIFLVMPIAELAVIIAVARSIGVPEAIGLMILVAIVGAWLAKREGLGMLQRIRAALDRGEMPNREVADGFLILFAAALMITPGFITDGLGLVLLFPPTRALVRRTLLAAALRRGQVTVMSGQRGRVRFGGNGFGADGRANGRDEPSRNGDGVWDVESWEEPPRGRDELGGSR